jgi:hypothetical protein
MKKLFVLFLIPFLILGCGKDKEDKELQPYKDVAVNFLNAIIDGDGEKVCNMLVPVVLEENYETLEECKQANSAFKKTDGNMTYKIVVEEKLTREDYNEWIGAAADYYGGIGKNNTSEVIEYEVELYSGKKLIDTVYFDVVNYKGSWLIVKSS